jgi:hypothetical protein
MLNYGVETTSNMLKQQRDLYMPGMSNFWNSLKIYFMVFIAWLINRPSNILVGGKQICHDKIGSCVVSFPN